MLASFTTLDGYRGPQPGRAVSSHRGVSQMVPETETVRDRDRDRQRDSDRHTGVSRDARMRDAPAAEWLAESGSRRARRLRPGSGDGAAMSALIE